MLSAKPSPKRMLYSLYLMSFLFVVHNALLMYINSSFLEQYIPLSRIGFLYTIAALFTIVVLSRMPSLLRKYGHYHVTTALFAITALSLLGLLSNIFWLVIPFFLIHEIVYVAMRSNSDLYLEEYSDDANTGTIRGINLTIVNLSIALSPLLVSLILTNGDYWKIYLISLVAMVFLTFYSLPVLRHIPDVEYNKMPFWHSVRKVWHRTDIRNIFLTSFLLQFFFSWMVIYGPIYLHQHVGFDWSALGIMFSIMLLPYVIFELPLGRIADKYLGEKELLIAGFIIMAAATAAIPFITGTNFILWTVVLFLTRFGASFVEIMGETYFFKKVDASNINAIEFFRDARPLAYILGPLSASLLLLFIDIKWLFLVLAGIVLTGVIFALQLHDTR